jgi:hypothetical protein
MFAHAFRFDASRLHAAFAPHKPRHPLARLAIGLLGLGVLALLVFFSVFVGAAMLTVGLLFRLFSQRARPVSNRPNERVAQAANVVDGEYRVVGKTVLPSA